jgi:hypothetical protein
MEKADEKESKITKRYSAPKIEIDCAIFNFEGDSLKVLLLKQKEKNGKIKWSLANDWIKEGETIAGTAQNILKKYIGSGHFFLEQLKAFGYSAESSQREDILIGYYALLKRDFIESNVSNSDFEWVGINEVTGLNEKHQIILDYSMNKLRKSICNSAIGFNLLPEKFTLLQVVQLYEEILGIEINKSNFRRKILQMGIILDSNEKEEDVSHRAAKFYKVDLQNQEMLSNRELNFNF